MRITGCRVVFICVNRRSGSSVSVFLWLKCPAPQGHASTFEFQWGEYPLFKLMISFLWCENGASHYWKVSVEERDSSRINEFYALMWERLLASTFEFQWGEDPLFTLMDSFRWCESTLLALMVLFQWYKERLLHHWFLFIDAGRTPLTYLRNKSIVSPAFKHGGFAGGGSPWSTRDLQQNMTKTSCAKMTEEI